MNREPFSIHPTLQAHIDPLTEEEFRLLEESILAEGVRDPLVVWREENVLVDGHHRKAICDRHGLPYSVVYRSFKDIKEAKRWMRLNQLSRRNLDREERERWIKELKEEFPEMTQREIATAVKCSVGSVNAALNPAFKNEHEPTVNVIPAAAEIESLQRKLEEAEAARRSTEQRLSAVKSDLKLAKMALDATPEVVERDKDFLRNKLKEEQERHDAERKELIAALNEAQAKARQVEVQVQEVRVPVESPEALAKIAELKQAIDAKDLEIATLAHAGKSVEKLTRERDQLRKDIDKARRDNERSLTEARANAAFQDALRCAGVFSAAVEAIERLARDGVLYVEHMTSARQLLRNVAGTATHGMSVLDSCDAETRSGNVVSLHEARGGRS